ncbi:CAP protein, partial [Metarhizium majus ARSEF 297]
MENNRTMHNLSTIMKRLEAVVSRLEDLSVFDGPVLPSTLTDSTSEAIQAFDDFIDSSVKQYLLLSNRLGGLVAVQAAEVFKGFQEQRKFLSVTTQAAKPDQATLETLLGPTKDAIVAVTGIQEKNRFDEMHVHLTAVADGIRMLAWVNIHSRPFVYVEESLGSAQFFGNKILKNQKDK